ncbi:MAG: hypothetical protein K0S19_648, partial [Geminicoccaceae bacterium]|nr:hypothetical protein [Geminicoccaceae bacterium]
MADWRDDLRAFAASVGARLRAGTNKLEGLVD